MTVTAPLAAAQERPFSDATGARARFIAAERHSRRVTLLKVALPAGALLAIAGFAVYSFLGSMALPTLDLSKASIEDGQLVMQAPQLDGFTSENLPYSLRAVRAVQSLGQTNFIKLEAVDARLPLGPDRYADVKAPNGVFDNGAYALRFDTEVSVSSNDGMSARFADARVELASGNFVTRGAVEIRLKGSSISAEGMTALDRGKVIIFQDKVRVTVEPSSINLAQNRTGTTDAGSQ